MDMDAVINSVAHISDPEPYQSQSIDYVSSVSQQIVELRSIVELLSDQVSILLSYVGVVESQSCCRTLVLLSLNLAVVRWCC